MLSLIDHSTGVENDDKLLSFRRFYIYNRYILVEHIDFASHASINNNYHSFIILSDYLNNKHLLFQKVLTLYFKMYSFFIHEKKKQLNILFTVINFSYYYFYFFDWILLKKIFFRILII